jgi:hypothetical protein
MKICVQSWLFFVLGLLANHRVVAQGCADALSNYVCADEPQQVDSLQQASYFNACIFNEVPAHTLNNTVWYSFHTNSIADVGDVSIAIDFVDCDFETMGPLQ